MSLINCTVGESGALKLRISSPSSARFTFMGQYREETPLCAVKTGENDYELTVPSIPGWSAATVFCG